MTDIVLDTCTLVHANDKKSNYREFSIKLIELILQNDMLIIVDEGFSMDEATNKSYIGLEYIKHLAPGMLGHALIQNLAQNKRFLFVSNKVPQAKKKYIEKIIRNKKDRMFLRVSLNSTEKILASHDYTDYQKKKRETIKKDIGVAIIEAEDVIVLLLNEVNAA